MRACNPREGRGAFESGAEGEELVMETGGAARKVAQEPALEQLVMLKQREERISPTSRWSEIATKVRKGHGVGLGIGLQVRLYRYSSIWGQRWCLWGYTRSYGEQEGLLGLRWCQEEDPLLPPDNVPTAH